jgi:uncharacterized protein YecE (DUF72 family)
MSQTRIGISGWRYEPWRGTFYPKGLPQRSELEYASRQFNTIELNGSFYSLQTPKSYQQWYDTTPEGFVFAVKAPRYITHLRRLKNVEEPLANFYASGLLALKEKLGPILWQFPPNFKFDPERFGEFLKNLPHDLTSASKTGKNYNENLKTKPYLAVEENHRLRHAVEIRHMSFLDERFVKMLRENNVAGVFADTAGKWPYFEDVTSDFIYCRLHGDEELYVSGYTPEAIQRWADRIRLWRNGREPEDAKRVDGAAKKLKARDVYVYFDNDVKVRAPADARELGKMLG